jgi:hypothetical protein
MTTDFGLAGYGNWRVAVMANPARGTEKELCASRADLVELRRSLEAPASRIDRELDPITRASWEDHNPRWRQKFTAFSGLYMNWKKTWGLGLRLRDAAKTR